MNGLSKPLVVAALVGTQLASADTLVLSPTDDSTIRASSGNQGTNQAIIVGDTTTADDYLRIALAFDLSSPLLTGATINSATLTLSVRSVDGSSENAAVTINLHQLTSSFTNGGVTWTSRDGTNDWITPGGDFGGVLTSLSANPRTVSLSQGLNFTGGTLANTAESAIGGSLYLLVKLDVENNGTRNIFQLASKENTTAAPAPVLTLDYTPGATTPPVIVPPTDPADDATGVPASTSLTATFNEPIALENGGTITIDDLGAGTDTVITLPDPRVSVVDDTDLVITPSSPLADGTDYAVLISSDAIKDLDPTPNFFAGISDPTVWNFQTLVPDTSAPTIIDLSPADGGAIPANGGLVATFDEAIMMAAQPGLLAEDFESGNGGFTVVTTEGSAWEHGTPDSFSLGGIIDSGNGATSGTGQCWGTNLGAYDGGSGDPGYYSASPTTSTSTCLRSAPIDLTGVTSAQLTFAQAYDLYAPDDLAVVNIIDDTTDTVIAGPIYTVPNGFSGWASSPVIDLGAGVGQVVRIEWCLTGTGGFAFDYLGWYIDDVTVTGSSAGGITLKNLTEGTETTYAVSDPAVTISGDTLTITPGAAALEEGDTYAVRITGDALADHAGNAFAGILDDSTWNFSVLGTILSAFDDRGDIAFAGPLNKTSPNDLGVGPISSGRFSRTYLTFDLTSASAASGETTLVLYPAGSENNTSSVAQTFTLFVLDSDWDGAAQPGPDGTAVATTPFTPQTGNDNRGISFTSTALTTAFNNALGGALHLGIKSDVEGDAVRSFLFLASREEPDFTDFEPRLLYQLAAGGDTFADWISGKTGVGGQTALGDDPDGDGNDNGVENFFGTEPGIFSGGLVISAVDTGAGTFTFTHPQGTLAGDLTATYRWSTDLVTFHDDGASSGGTTVSFSTVPNPVVAGTPTAVTATVTGTPVQKLFVRVEVSQN